MKKTALYEAHLKLGAKMVSFAGYEMPVSYSSIKEEHLAVRNDVGIFDVSHMGEFELKGKDATPLLQWVCSNDISRMKEGQCQYNCLPNLQGGIVDDLIVYKFTDEHYYLVVNASNIEKDWNWINSQAESKSFKVSLKDLSNETALIAVQGPNAKTLLQTLTSEDLEAIEYYHYKIGEMAGVQDVIISNTGYTGSGGFELYVSNQNATKLWEALLEKGKNHQLKPAGLAARDTLRLEKGFCLYGNDINDNTSPIEAGLSWITKFTKNFVHADYHKSLKEKGVVKKLVGFEMIDKGIPRKDYEVVNENGEKIGVVTSGTQSPSLGKAIGLAYLNKKYTSKNTIIYILLRNKELKAVVASTPFL